MAKITWKQGVTLGCKEPHFKEFFNFTSHFSTSQYPHSHDSTMLCCRSHRQWSFLPQLLVKVIQSIILYPRTTRQQELPLLCQGTGLSAQTVLFPFPVHMSP